MKKSFYGLAMLALLAACNNPSRPSPQPAPTSSSPSVSNSSQTTQPAPKTKTEEEIIQDLAAFYTGMDEGKNVLLTLNADAKRSFTLDIGGKETYGIWEVAGGIVTLNDKKGSSRYEVVANGLLPLNPDGTKRDPAASVDLLLTKVMGE